MIEMYLARTSTIDRLCSGPIGSDLDDLATALQQQGYARDSIRNYLRGCDQFARWLSQHGYAPSDVSEAASSYCLRPSSTLALRRWGFKPHL
jgi:hypothetical protein